MATSEIFYEGRRDTYTGGEHYWIRPHNGTHEVRRETGRGWPDNETVFTGSYEACVAYLTQLEIDNAEYDLGL